MGRRRIENHLQGGKFPRVMYGLNGICVLFGVSKTTAFKMSKGILKDACTKQGGIMLINTRKALELFGCQHPEDLIISSETVKVV